MRAHDPSHSCCGSHDHSPSHTHSCGEAPSPGLPDGVICHCFGHTRASLEAEFRAKGHVGAIAEVAEKVRAGEARCQELHPRGVCCLPDLRRVMIHLQNLPPRPDPGSEGECSSCSDTSGCSSCH